MPHHVLLLAHFANCEAIPMRSKRRFPLAREHG